MLKILDSYILKKFFSTLFFILLLLAVIFIVIDINEKYNRLTDSKQTIGDALLHYYPFLMIWVTNMFFSIVVFISVIWFTSRITNQTEVVAIISSGTSFYRFSKPYFVGGILIGLVALLMNHFILPWVNIKKNKYETEFLQTTTQKEEYNTAKVIASQLSPNEYLFVNSYNRITKSGTGFHYQKFDSLQRLVRELRADELVWNEIDTQYVLRNYYEKIIKIPPKNDSLMRGTELKERFQFTPDELLPESYVAETMNSIQLMDFIEREKMKGSGSIEKYLAELYKRTSLPVAVVILTILALSLSSTKRRGGIGINLALGIVIAFVFIFSFQALLIISEKGTLNPFLAVWLPNIVFGILAVYLYLKRANA